MFDHMRRLVYKDFLSLLALSLGSVGFIMSGGVSAAQASECACKVPAGSMGSVAKLTGDVMVSQQSGYSSASTDTRLSEGMRVIVGQSSSASISLPRCSMNLTSSSIATLIREENQLCLRIESATAEALQQKAGTLGAASNWVPVAGALVTGGLVIAIANDKEPVSR